MSNFAIKGKPWLIRGSQDVSDCRTSQEVMKKSGLDFTVGKAELTAKMPITPNNFDLMADDQSKGRGFIRNDKFYSEVTGYYATYRQDNNIPLGFVKERYEIVQNKDAFKFFDDAIGKDKAKWERAGRFGNGERIFVAAKLPDNITVKGDICENYLVFTNNHDGGGSVQILFTPIRIICQNTLNSAIRLAENYVRFRHTASVHSNIRTGVEILGIAKEKMKMTEELYNQLASIKITDEDVKEFLAKQVLSSTEMTNLEAIDNTFGIRRLFNRDGMIINDVGISTKKVNQLTTMFEYYQDGPGQSQFTGTAWGAYNTITGYNSNIKPTDGEKRTNDILFGKSYSDAQSALEMAFAW